MYYKSERTTVSDYIGEKFSLTTRVEEEKGTRVGGGWV